jgi:hypothetical protein
VNDVIGLKNIKLTASLVYDDGVVITFSTPLYDKGIRNGEFFSDDQAKAILAGVGADFAGIVEEKTLKGLYAAAKSEMYGTDDVRKPKYGDDFSQN